MTAGRLAATALARRAVARSARRSLIDLRADAEYWLVDAAPGMGAARSASFAACAALAPGAVDPDISRVLVGPWQKLPAVHEPTTPVEGRRDDELADPDPADLAADRGAVDNGSPPDTSG